MRKNEDTESGRILSLEFILEEASLAVAEGNREQKDVDNELSTDGLWHFSDLPFDVR